MRGWWLGWCLIGAFNLAGVFAWHYDEGIAHPENFENRDTRTIVARLEKPHPVWQWFTGDWVLGNGFYRPLPSLLYELDHALWGHGYLAYKWTNGVLAVLRAWLVVWLVWELARQRAVAWGTGLLFSLWQTGFLVGVPAWLGWLALMVGLLWGGWRSGDWRKGLTLGALGAVVLWEFGFIPNLPDLHVAPFAYRAMGWIPGRTATLMTLFALISLSGYCRYCRTGHLGWAVASLVGFMGALGSHEGAVALPGLMALCGWAISRNGGRFQGWVIATAFGLLVLHLLFYRFSIPTDTEYHRQRLKRFKNLSDTWMGWLCPPAPRLLVQVQILLDAPLALFLPIFWSALVATGVYLLALVYSWRRDRVALVGWLGSLMAYIPLSPVIPLMHYYYMPSVFRALWVVSLMALLVGAIHRFAQASVARPPKHGISRGVPQ